MQSLTGPIIHPGVHLAKARKLRNNKRKRIATNR